MAHFNLGERYSTEGKRFVDDMIQIYTDNKVGQYSKYLGTSQFFATYFSINDVMSRADTGTGNFEAEIGPNSPLRFNQINGFPMYNLPEMKPEFIRDERGSNIELTLSDITILPNTVKPKHSDYVLFSFPNMQKMLFRVTEFNYNSIQSNDFYTVNLELRYIGDNVYDVIAPQVVEKYLCVFENIGTQDKCLIKVEDVVKIIDLEAAILELKQLFKDLYFQDDTGIVGVKSSQKDLCSCCDDTQYSPSTGLQIIDKGFSHYHFLNANTSLWAQSSDNYMINEDKNGFTMLYDLYATRFLNESKIFDGGLYSDYMYQVYDDRLPANFDFMYRKTIWYAVLTKSLRYLSPYLFFSEQDISKTTSLLVMHNYDAISIALDELKGYEGDKLEFYNRYFSKALITTLIKLRDSRAHSRFVGKKPPIKSNVNNGIIGNEKDHGLFNSALVDEDYLPEKEVQELIELPDLTYIENLIKDYFFNQPAIGYDLQMIIDEILEPSLENYHKLLITIYILTKIHDAYFDKAELNNEEKGRLAKWQRITTQRS